MNLSINRSVVNLEGLDSELRASLPERFDGASFDGTQVTLYFSEDTTEAVIASATRIVAEHDPTRLTPAQEEAANQVAQLKQLRAQNPTMLDLSAYEVSTPEIYRLAEKIAWLEQEILALRREA